MLRLPDLLSVSGGARAVRKMRSGIKSPSLSRTIVSDDAAVVIRNPRYIHQTEMDTQDQQKDPFLHLTIEDTLEAVKEKVAELRQLAQDIRNGRFSANNAQAGAKASVEDTNNTETTKLQVYSDVSKLLMQLKEEIGKIKSFDGFLLGVHDKIEKFKPPAEFDLDQVQDVEEHMAKVTEKLELGIFSLARVHEEALKALRCQDEPQPDRVFKLLQDEDLTPSFKVQGDTQTAASEKAHVATVDPALTI